jgi:uncharacterized protein
MSPEERDLISGVFERMRSVGTIEKDREAETFINSSVRQIPDSAYMLVQSVLVQEQALQQADQRIRDLEDQVNQMSAELEAGRKSGSSSGGSFLGGLFGGSKPAPAPQASSPWGSSVPSTGRRAGGFGGPAPSQQPWANQQPPQQGGFNQAPMQMQQPQAAQGGGFMRSAMTTAAGVAGGMLVAGAIGNMMRGNSEGGTHNTSGSGAAEPNYQDANSNDQGGTYTNEPAYQDASTNDQGTDPGVQDAAFDDAGSGWDAGGGDFEA